MIKGIENKVDNFKDEFWNSDHMNFFGMKLVSSSKLFHAFAVSVFQEMPVVSLVIILPLCHKTT